MSRPCHHHHQHQYQHNHQYVSRMPLPPSIIPVGPLPMTVQTSFGHSLLLLPNNPICSVISFSKSILPYSYISYHKNLCYVSLFFYLFFRFPIFWIIIYVSHTFTFLSGLDSYIVNQNSPWRITAGLPVFPIFKVSGEFRGVRISTRGVNHQVQFCQAFGSPGEGKLSQAFVKSWPLVLRVLSTMTDSDS